MIDSDIPDYAEVLTLRRRRRRVELWHQLDITMKRTGQKLYPARPLLGLPGIGLSPVAVVNNQGRSVGWHTWGEAAHAVSGRRTDLGTHRTRDAAIDAALNWYTAQAQILAHHVHRTAGGEMTLNESQQMVYEQGAAGARDWVMAMDDM